MRTRSWVLGALSIGMTFTANPSFAQYTGRFAVTISFAPGSGGSFSAADGVVFNTTALGSSSGSVLWSAANLGLSGVASPNVDALSDGTDFVFPPSVATCTDVVVEYGVTSASAGAPGSLVQIEKADDGAASDVFSKTFSGGLENFAYLATDHQNVAPATQIDALAWVERPMYPIFFSVDGPTATELSKPVPTGLGFTVTPADILMVTNPGGVPSIFRSFASLGLTANDDIDALAIDYYQFGTIFLSLSAGSPSVNPSSSFPAKSATAAGIIVYDGAFPPAVYKDPDDLDLANTDDLTALRISDPCLAAFQGPAGSVPFAGLVDGNEPSPSTPFPWNFETIRVDNHVGNSRRQVWIESTDPPIVVTIRTQYPTETAIVWVGFGSICSAFASTVPVPPAKGYLGFPITLVLPPITPGIPGATFNVAASSFPVGLQINLQGIVSTGVPGEAYMTNIVTIVAVP